MKKSVGVMIAVIATFLTMGAAFAVQHYVSADQAVTTQEKTMSSSTSSHASSQVATSSSQKKRTHESRKKASDKHSGATASSRERPSAKRTRSRASSASSAVAHRRRTTKQTRTTSATTTKQATAAPKRVATQTAHLVVSGHNRTFFRGNVKIGSKATAFSVLQASKLKLVYQNGVSVYVSSINGLAENDIKTGSGWKYTVNGKFIDKGANLAHDSNHDSVHWYFTTKGY